MDSQEIERYGNNGIFDYEAKIEVKQIAAKLLSDLSKLSAKLTTLGIREKLDNEVGESLVKAVIQLSALDKVLSADIKNYRKRFSQTEEKNNAG